MMQSETISDWIDIFLERNYRENAIQIRQKIKK